MTEVAVRTADRRQARVPGLTDPVVMVYLALAGVTALGFITVEARGGDFLTLTNVVGILHNSVVLGLVALGQTAAILTGSLDLSVAYLISICTLVAAETMNGQDSRVLPAMLVVLGMSATVGLINGIVITKLQVNAFIATLGVAFILRGYIEDNYTGPAGKVPVSFQHLGYDRIGPIPVSAFVLAGATVALWLVLRRTRLGYHMYAVGGDEQIARLSGVRTHRVKIAAHVLCSLSAGVAGLILASRLGAGAPWAGTEARYDLESIAAVVLGGTVLAGGRGGVAGTLGGVLILAVLDSVFNQLGVDPFFKNVVRGAVIIAAVALYARRGQRAGDNT
ncbi:ABC transporter permease [Actinomadura alba]|uniref:ABC transporter permease n=1 Tax=Actinomadura alba TaxID=406431 RepID=A0ABR7M025_9ACTN|nr:ABC transporter permease [Actinomadura alba]MBC6470082.1 ABC transporter permease [Actinomadura alba]